MTDEAHYRSTAPDVLAALADTERRYQDTHEAIHQFGDRFDRPPMVARSRDRYALVGLSGDTTPGPGWRHDGHAWIPDRRTKAGKELAAEIFTIRAEKLGVLPGMPSMVIVGSRWLSPAIVEHDGIVFVRWRTTHDEVEANRWGTYDPSKWERTKASAFHLAIEANEAADDAQEVTG